MQTCAIKVQVHVSGHTTHVALGSVGNVPAGGRLTVATQCNRLQATKYTPRSQQAWTFARQPAFNGR